jgi:hypothetical protein
MVDPTIVEQHFGKHTGLPRLTKGMSSGVPGGAPSRKAGGLKVQTY